jgi:hypothetical protein
LSEEVTDLHREARVFIARNYPASEDVEFIDVFEQRICGEHLERRDREEFFEKILC